LTAEVLVTIEARPGTPEVPIIAPHWRTSQRRSPTVAAAAEHVQVEKFILSKRELPLLAIFGPRPDTQNFRFAMSRVARMV